MGLSPYSEFAEEYLDWLNGCAGQPCSRFEASVAQLEPAPPVVVAPDSSLRAAIELLARHDQGALLVICDERVVGTFGARDVLERVLPRALDLDRARVDEAMTPRPDLLTEATSIAEALRTMAHSPHGALPVLNAKGQPVAVVSPRQLLQFVAEALENDIANAPPEPRSGVFAVDGG